MNITDEIIRSIEYWDKKIKRVVKISAENGFPEYNEEFWKTQVAGVISLVDQLNAEKNEIELKLLKRDSD